MTPSGVYEKTQPHRAKLAAALKGTPLTAQRRVHITEAMQEPDVKARLAEASYKGEAIGYNAAHWRASRALPRDVCGQDSAGCKGRLEFALRHDAPDDLVRVDVKGRRYYVGDEPADGYMVLCSRHHKFYDHPELQP